MTKRGETDAYKASDFLKAFEYYLGDSQKLNVMVANVNHLAKEVVEVYKAEGKNPVEVNEKECLSENPNLKITKDALAIYYPKEHILRHDSNKLAQLILSI